MENLSHTKPMFMAIGSQLSKKKNEDTVQKELRRIYSLPVTKQLVYYPFFCNKICEPEKIISYQRVKDIISYDEENNIYETCCILKIQTETGRIINILNLFLSEMQELERLKVQDNG